MSKAIVLEEEELEEEAEEIPYSQRMTYTTTAEEGVPLEDWPDNVRGLFSTLLSGSGWKITDGDLPGYFKGKPRGARCLWSCGWLTSQGPLHPDTFAPIELLQ